MEKNLVVFFLLFFAAVWLAGATIPWLMWGWFRLMETYPDQTAAPILQLSGQSGTMGLGPHMNGILTLTVCSSGLRVGMMRLFGPFCRDFFVPWEHISVTRKTILFWPFARLQFGEPAVGTLRISAHVADRLARAAKSRWPEAGPFPEETRGNLRRRLLREWALVTFVAALFFTLTPLIVAPKGPQPGVVAILLPAIVFGVATIIKFLREGG